MCSVVIIFFDWSSVYLLQAPLLSGGYNYAQSHPGLVVDSSCYVTLQWYNLSHNTAICQFGISAEAAMVVGDHMHLRKVTASPPHSVCGLSVVFSCSPPYFSCQILCLLIVLP